MFFGVLSVKVKVVVEEENKKIKKVVLVIIGYIGIVWFWLGVIIKLKVSSSGFDCDLWDKVYECFWYGGFCLRYEEEDDDLDDFVEYDEDEDDLYVYGCCGGYDDMLDEFDMEVGFFDIEVEEMVVECCVCLEDK